ncbi:MAG TPA: sensor histidine kinase [Allosphingosinicella sp.]
MTTASTGAKMLLFLSLGLLPLGLIAVLASVESARENNTQDYEEVRARLELKAERINGVIGRGMLMLKGASLTGALPVQDAARCGAMLQNIAASEQLPGRYALFSGGLPVCKTAGYQVDQAIAPPADRSGVEIAADGRTLRFAVIDAAGAVQGVGEVDREQLAALVEAPELSETASIFLSGGGRRLQLRDGVRKGALGGELTFSQPVAGDRLTLNMVTGRAALSPVEFLVIILPILMWIAAALIGWLIVDRLLLKPLARMQRAVAAYQPGDRDLALPASASPAREIGELGQAFARVTQTVSRHEAELEAGLERQIRLVREVHHRVKNNLQVVASLLNLHARGATSPDASAAYASIQRRVDALAVVHRNHYAELEDNRGVALKPLLSELGANLRANAPAEAASMQIRMSVEPVYATQDVAVSVAFLVTELVEFAMFCGARLVTVAMEQVRPNASLLSIESEALQGKIECDTKLAERFDRIVTGLSRQLRSVLTKDLETGRYSLEIAIVGRGDG